MPLPDIPEAISFEAVRELVIAFGLPVSDLRWFEIGTHAVRAEYLARDADGNTYVGDRREATLATHVISIPIVRGVE